MLLKVHYDTADVVNKKCMAALQLLASLITGSFKCVGNIHMETGSSISWIKCCLSDRLQDVTIGNSNSEGKCLDSGVPQGSVLVPCKYCLYSKPIGEICCQHNLLYHCYADDTQVYIAILPKETWLDALKKLEAHLVEISTWMCANMNQEKTELIIFNPKYKCRRMTKDIQLQAGEKTVCVAESVKNWGYTLTYL